MPASNRPNESDFRAIFAIAGECRDLGDDPIVWRQHFFARTAGLLGADIVVGGEIAGLLGRRPESLGTTDWGWAAGFDRAGWEQAQREFANDPRYDPALIAYLGHLGRADRGVTLARQQLLPDRDWYRAPVYEAVHAVIGTDACLYAFARLPAAPTDFAGLIVTRAAGRRPFGDRECRVAHELHAAIAPLIGGPLARFMDPSPSQLAPRVRQVLRCLLEGDGDKQVAARLGIRPHTVNQYVKIIYRHFGVASRAELLARWIRRGWGARAEWDAR